MPGCVRVAGGDAVKAVIPVAGKGTRLRPHTHTIPKPLVNVAGKPILGHIIEALCAAGVRQMAFVVDRRGDSIPEFVRQSYPDIDSEFVEQATADGLGGAIHRTRAFGTGGPLLILLGDTILRADFRAIVGRDANLIGVKPVEDPRRFGVCLVDGDRITGMVEKPDTPISNLAIVGVYRFTDATPLYDALDENVRRGIRTRGEFQLTDALQRMIEAGVDMRTFPIEGWFDCGTIDTLLATNRYLLAEHHQPPRACPGNLIVPPVAIHDSAVLVGSIVGPNVSVAAGARVTNSIVRDSIIHNDAVVENALLDGSVVGNRASVLMRCARLNVGDSTELDFH
jgi:glucose-1-phosphate thymidylyltransferase